MKRKLAFILLITLLITLVPSTALADTYTVGDGETLNLTTGDLTTTVGGTPITTYTIGDGDTVTVAANATATITGSKNVMISCGAGVALTIDGVTSDVSGTKNGCALAFTGTGNTLNLVGDSVLASWGLAFNDGEPGIRVETGTVLIIGSESNGTVTATGGEASAGIGGGYDGAGGTIEISGGTVTATGGCYGAGIGVGWHNDGGTIEISGGTVTATGGFYGAGIGGGDNSAGGTIEISGGTVTATGGESGAGIGGGNSGDGGDIDITGSTVIATGGANGAGIGGGYDGDGGDISICGGEVYADGDTATGAKDIGHGNRGTGGTLNISGDAAVFTRDNPTTNSLTPTTSYHTLRSDETISSSSAYGYTNIPGGWSGTAYAYLTTTLLIDDSYIDAVGTTQTDVDALAHTIDKINIDTTQAITIKDSNKTARDIQIEGLCSDVALTIEDLEINVSGITDGCALAFTGAGNTLNLEGESVLTSCGDELNNGQPGIKVEWGWPTSTELTIGSTTNGILTANGETGIGGGYSCDGGTISITGGTVKANGQRGAGIGGGEFGSTGEINISGGVVEAGSYGKGQSAGIGSGGLAYSQGQINITDGTVTATGSLGAAGIGGGANTSGGEINIFGGTVTANGGSWAAGIGGGFNSFGTNNVSGGDINISGGTVTAIGGIDGGAGIGGGDDGSNDNCNNSGGDIDITGGIVTAIGGATAAGIGGGEQGESGDITITGGEVYADGDTATGAKDIGSGRNDTGGTLNISGDAAVFTRDNPTTNSLTPTTNYHVLHSDETISSSAAYEYTNIPSGWSGTAYAYLTTTLVIDDAYIADAGTTVVDVDTLKAHIKNIHIDTTQAITIRDSNKTARDIQIKGLCSNVDLTIDDLELDVSGTSGGCALAFTGAGNTLDLVGDSALTSWGDNVSYSDGEPGIRVEAGTALTIGSETDGTVTATGGYYGAGIGGGYYGNGGNIDITGGTVEANGGYYSSGIGGGYYGNGGTVNITNGKVITTGGSRGSGIGGGYRGDGGDVKISGGEVYASCHSYYGSGIGGGYYGNGGNIHISGGTVEAEGGFSGAGIGGGYRGNGGEIDISGGAVQAKGGDDDDDEEGGAGIGGGCRGDGGEIDISGGTVTANGGENGAGIGGGYGGDGGSITIAGSADVDTTGGRNGSGLGGGLGGDGGSITIDGGSVSATAGSFGGSGLGGGNCGNGGTIKILDGTVTAKGGGSAAGIGGGIQAEGGSITIKGGTVTAIGGSKGAGIGGGYLGNGGTIILSGGVIAAEGHADSLYDIGDGNDSSGGTVEISNTAVVFLKNDTIITPTTSTHTHEVISSVTDDKVYGVSANGWTPSFGVYMRLYTLDYNANGGTGSTESVTQHIGTTIAADDNSSISRDTYTFGDWNTQADDSGTSYAVGDDIVVNDDITLFAQWNEIRVESVTLSSDAEKMTHHDTLILTADVVPTNATYPEATWKSSDTDVATVDANGKVTAVGVGSATITATADGISDKCDITVTKKAVTNVTLSSDAETITHHDTLTLTAQVSPSNATYPEVTWKSSDTDVATVDESGKVTAVGAGSATITATADGKSDTCDITVNKKAVTSVTLSSDAETMTVDDTKTLTAQVSPSNATYSEVTWKSSDTDVATVDANGKVTAVGVGSATITATADGKSDVCAITVKAKYGAPTQTPEPTETSEPSGKATSEPSDEATTEPTDTGQTDSDEAPIPVAVVETDEETGDMVVQIVVADLPKGTTAIQTPSGEIIYTEGKDTVEITLHADELNEDGTVELIALDEQETPLGKMEIYVPQADETNADASDTGSGVGQVLMWVLIGLGGLGAIGTAGYFILKRRKTS